MITVCSWCRKVKIGEKWVRFYIEREMSRTHGICPDCEEEIEKENERREK
jgi:hypothetical protein